MPEQHLIETLGGGHWSERIEAVEAAAEHLAGGAADADWTARLAECFTGLAGHENAQLRTAVARALLHLDHAETPRLLALLAEDPDRYVREAAKASRDKRRARGRSALHHDDNAEVMNRLYRRVEERFNPRDRKLFLKLADELNHHFVREAFHELVRIITPLEMDVGQLVKKTADMPDLAVNADGAQRKVWMLTDLLTDLRAFTQDGSVEMQAVRLGKLVAEAAELLGTQAAELGEIAIRADIPEDMEIRANLHRLLQALINLLVNAAEAGADQLWIEARPVGREHVELILRDDGAGMKPQNARDALLLYTTSKRDGLGMGLPLAKKIVEFEHDGQFILSSRLGEGTTVRILLPVAGPGDA